VSGAGDEGTGDALGAGFSGAGAVVPESGGVAAASSGADGRVSARRVTCAVRVGAAGAGVTGAAGTTAGGGDASGAFRGRGSRSATVCGAG